MKCFIVFLLLVSCSRYPTSPEYREQYAHLSPSIRDHVCMQETPCFLVILVDARHLDYTDNISFFRTMTKHPSDGSKNCDVGHAWVYVRGEIDGKRVEVEGGHSGELGARQARFFEGVLNNLEYGYANPTKDQRKHYRYEPNPIKYLWESQNDGFFEQGSGHHRPTFAAKVDLTQQQFELILSFMKNYNYADYALTRNQCSTFVAEVAALADFPIEHKQTMQIEPCLGQFRLWSDPKYATITFSTPDVVERSLMEAVRGKRAEYALSWYRRHRPVLPGERFSQICESVRRFPARYRRALLFQ